MTEYHAANIILCQQILQAENTCHFVREKLSTVRNEAERAGASGEVSANIIEMALVFDYLADMLRASVNAEPKNWNKYGEPLVVPPGTKGYISYNADKFDVMDDKLYNRATGTIVAHLNGAATRPFYETRPAPAYVGDDLK